MDDTDTGLRARGNRELAPDEVIAVIAHVLTCVGPATTAIGGRFGFRVHGERGGDWVVDLRVSGGEWSRPQDATVVENCDATLYFENEAFSHLITQPDFLETHVKSGEIAVAGDRGRLSRLGKLLSSSGSMLNQRVVQSTQRNGATKKPRRDK